MTHLDGRACNHKPGIDEHNVGCDNHNTINTNTNDNNNNNHHKDSEDDNDATNNKNVITTKGMSIQYFLTQRTHVCVCYFVLIYITWV